MDIKKLIDVSNEAANLPEGTEQHSFSVAALSYTLSQLLKFSQEESICIALAASTHDIGKQKTPLEVLHKNGKLTEEEFKVMKKHTSDGAKFLEKFENTLGKHYSLFKDVALHHHETIDGKGYYGKTGNQVSIPANLVSFVDIFDALRSERSYKKSNSFEESKRILENMSSKFHPEIYKIGMANLEILNNVFEYYRDRPCKKDFIETLPDMLQHSNLNKKIGNFSYSDLNQIFSPITPDKSFEMPNLLCSSTVQFELPNSSLKNIQDVAFNHRKFQI